MRDLLISLQKFWDFMNERIFYYVTTLLMLHNIISNEIENDCLKKHYVIKTVIIKNVELKLSNETLVTGIEKYIVFVQSFQFFRFFQCFLVLATKKK